jgi:hypothetical protein
MFYRARKYLSTLGNGAQLAQSPSVPKSGALVAFRAVIPPLP